MIQINNLTVLVEGKKILNGLNLEVKQGEKHIIMGSNGSGKSTLANVIIGNPNYEIQNGEILFNSQNINELSIEERAHLGIFMSFQSPPAIEGVSNMQFLRQALNSHRKAHNLEELSASEFLKKARQLCADLNIANEFLSRSLNDGFSGGERKKNEILQMMLLQPKFIILDEIDSGLDVDAIKLIATKMNEYLDSSKSLLMITHYAKIAQIIKPDRVSIIKQGQIVQTGDSSLIQQIEQQGFNG